MCFSAEADFISAGVIGAVGLATLREVDSKRELPLAALPLAFAAHQFSEGFVWLGLQGSIAKSVGDVALYAYVFYAWAILPFLAPLAVMLVEPLRSRRKVMTVLVALGAVVGIYLLWTVATSSVTAHITENTIQYRGVGDSGDFMTALYVIATCGTFLMSSQRRIRWFGIANSVAVGLIAWEQKDGLTSLWCLWGAIVSVLIYFQFLDWRRDERAFTGVRAARS
jgi:hypothetical protein